jgi:hypothetical protein
MADSGCLLRNTYANSITVSFDESKEPSAESLTTKRPLHKAAIMHEGMLPVVLCQHGTMLQGEYHQQEPAVINVINRNQLPRSEPSMVVQGMLPGEAGQGAGTTPHEVSLQRNRYLHHLRARLVRFDPTGQVWCDRLECWDCYCLMKIGEALGYRSLIERGGKLLIEEGMEAWATYVRTQRAFLIAWATQEALALCRALGIQEPDLSGEVKRLMEVQPLPP